MTEQTTQALENIYTALHNNNHEIDDRIAELKTAIDGNTVEMQAERLPLNNREGRKTLQAYFKKQGIIVNFAK